MYTQSFVHILSPDTCFHVPIRVCTYTVPLYVYSSSHPLFVRIPSPLIHVFTFPSLFARTLSPPIYVFTFPSHFERILSPPIHVFEFPSHFVRILSPLIHVFAFPSLFPEVRRCVPLVARSSGAMAAVGCAFLRRSLPRVAFSRWILEQCSWKIDKTLLQASVTQAGQGEKRFLQSDFGFLFGWDRCKIEFGTGNTVVSHSLDVNTKNKCEIGISRFLSMIFTETKILRICFHTKLGSFSFEEVGM